MKYDLKIKTKVYSHQGTKSAKQPTLKDLDFLGGLGALVAERLRFKSFFFGYCSDAI
jgi:hypothetical protein